MLVHVDDGKQLEAACWATFSYPSPEMLAAAFRPYVETCIKAFGISRAMFESNFPVDKIAYSCPVFSNACKLLTNGASGAEKADLFAGAAARFYRLNVTG